MQTPHLNDDCDLDDFPKVEDAIVEGIDIMSDD
jgi:hypothetical protein